MHRNSFAIYHSCVFFLSYSLSFCVFVCGHPLFRSPWSVRRLPAVGPTAAAVPANPVPPSRDTPLTPTRARIRLSPTPIRPWERAYCLSRVSFSVRKRVHCMLTLVGAAGFALGANHVVVDRCACLVGALAGGLLRYLGRRRLAATRDTLPPLRPSPASDAVFPGVCVPGSCSLCLGFARGCSGACLSPVRGKQVGFSRQ